MYVAPSASRFDRYVTLNRTACYRSVGTGIAAVFADGQDVRAGDKPAGAHVHVGSGPESQQIRDRMHQPVANG